MKVSRKRNAQEEEEMTSSKKANIMSLAIDSEIQEKIKVIAKKRNISSSKLIRDIVEKHLSHSDEDVDTVVFKIPESAKKDRAEPKNWFLIRVESVVKALIDEKK